MEINDFGFKCSYITEKGQRFIYLQEKMLMEP